MAAPTEPALPEAAAAAPDESSNRRTWIGRVALGALAVGAIYGATELYAYETHGKYVEETNDAYVKADGVTVSSKLAGYVRAVGVTDNQTVGAGALLVQVDPTDFTNRLAQASAQVEVARAAQVATLAGIAEAEAAVAQASAALDAARRDLAYLNGEVARFRPLVASGAESKQTLDQLAANRDKAASDVAARQAAVAAARGRIQSIRAQADQSGAQIKAAQVQQDSAGNDLKTTRIAAPVAGKVGNSSVRVGQFVQPGQRLMTIVPTQAIYIEANFKETQIGLMRPGQPVTIKVDALPDVDFHGTVESITPGTGANFSLIPPQNATGNFTKIVQRVPVRIRINAGVESRKVLVPGLSLTVRVDTNSAKASLDAIRREQEQVAGK